MLDGESETHGHMHMCGVAHACIHGLITTNGRAPPPAYDRIRLVAARYRVRLTAEGCVRACTRVRLLAGGAGRSDLRASPSTLSWVPPCERGRAGLR